MGADGIGNCGAGAAVFPETMSLWQPDLAFYLVLAVSALAMVQGGRSLGRFAIPLAVLVLGLSVLVPTRSLVSFGVSLMVVGVLYTLRPFASAIPVVGALLLNPFFRYFDTVAGFEMRLWLSRLVGSVLNAAGYSVEVLGNVMVLDGATFAVDEACIGINLMLTGLAVAVAIPAVLEQRERRVLPAWLVASGLIVAVYLIVSANFLRICGLVLMQWGPAHPMHEIYGLICFGGVVAMPLALAYQWSVRRYGEAPGGKGAAVGVQLALVLCCLPLLWIGFGRAAAVSASSGPLADSAWQASPVCGVLPELRANQVAAYNFGDALLYIKPVPAFYHAEHSPTICWRGSGYTFTQIERRVLEEDFEVYTATLTHPDHQLHTAWWMSNGTKHTINQASWRIDMASGGATYSLYNVTAATKQEVLEWVERVR